MSDPRITLDQSLCTRADAARIVRPVVDLCRAPEGARDRQLLFGESVTVHGDVGEWCYVQARKDGYCGYVRAEALGEVSEPTHVVTAPATHLYAEADFKSPDRMSLSFGSLVTVLADAGRYLETAEGYVPRTHISPLPHLFEDPAAVAALFLGTPYLWGGNSRFGIDCSGLVQAALLACGTACPGDSDMQETLGKAAEGGYVRNDLLFWKGHVALVVDAERLIHANAHAMAVVHEPIEAAIARIAAQGDGPVTGHRRVELGATPPRG